MRVDLAVGVHPDIFYVEVTDHDPSLLQSHVVRIVEILHVALEILVTGDRIRNLLV